MAKVKFVINSKTELACEEEECGAPMIVKENRSNGHQFLGCSRYPDCKFTCDIPQSMIMRVLGQPELFDD